MPPSTPPPRLGHGPWPVQVQANGPTACGAVAWKYRGQVQATAIVKASFAIAPGAPMTSAAPDELRVADVHFDGDPRRSIAAASDLAPYQARTDVVLTGHAWWRPGEPAQGKQLRMALLRERVLLDKTLYLTDPTGGAQTAYQVPLGYERALGGRGWDENPIGTSARPTLVDLDNPSLPACFAPLPRAWPVRDRLLRSMDRRALEPPLLDLPSDFDWTFFQTAPIDQRTELLQGDEWILLKGLHPTLPTVKTQLPSMRALGQVYGLGGTGARPIALNADTLHIDVDRQTCSITWRATFPVGTEEALAGVRVAVSFEVTGQPSAEVKPPPQPSRAAARKLRTGMLKAMSGDMMSPFGSPPEVPAPEPPREVRSLGTTLPVPAPPEPPREVRSFGTTLPVPSPPEAPAMEITQEGRGIGGEGIARDAASASAPFPLAGPGAARSGGGVEIPGAPWAATPAAPAPETSDPMAGTLILRAPAEIRAAMARAAEAAAPAPPAPVDVPPPMVEPAPLAPVPLPPPVAAPPPAPPVPREAVWAQPLPEPPPAPRAPPRAPNPAPPQVKSSLYGKFGPSKK
jgi:hypothetical protein